MPKPEKMKTPIVTEDKDTSKFNFYYLVILVLTLLIPAFIFKTTILENAFERPKTLLLVCGAALLIGLYAVQLLRGKPVTISNSQTPKILIFLLLLNGFNLFYTKNYYYTCLAAAMHVSCLIVFYITATHIDQKKAFWILMAAALAGLFVAFVTLLQFFDIFIFYKGRPGMMVVGTIGNSNHLGAYLLFPVLILFFLSIIAFKKIKNANFNEIFIATLTYFLLIVVSFTFMIARARASWLAFLIALPVFVLITLKIKVKFTSAAKYLFIILFSLTLIISSVLYYKVPKIRNTFSFNSIFTSDTFHLRVNKYWPSVWQLLKKTPSTLLFGNGFWSYRNMVYEAQAEINERTGDFFKDYPEPKPREAHNDLIEVFSEGGILLAFALFFFLVIVLRHGWLIIRNVNLETETRLIAATAFSSVIAIMGASIFFFPFRVNTTMFLAALMMGILEGIYLTHFQLLQLKTFKKSPGNALLIALLCILLIGFCKITAIDPLRAEMTIRKYDPHLDFALYLYNQKQYQRSQLELRNAEETIEKALAYDPLNTAFNLKACLFYVTPLKMDYQKANDYLEKAINHFNGDIVLWSLYDIKGRLKLQLGSPLEAKVAFEKALHLNPEFRPAHIGLAMAEKALAEKIAQPNATNKN
ncbi:MAG: hypothetical protein EHM45_00350 [Desulfobacteraceae bacterium]|nr:MAG: hypothetical protein EHM45_00350 [Desulfobacteraceae bacterium]